MSSMSMTATTNNRRDDCERRKVEMEQGDNATGEEQANTRRREVSPRRLSP